MIENYLNSNINLNTFKGIEDCIFTYLLKIEIKKLNLISDIVFNPKYSNNDIYNEINKKNLIDRELLIKYVRINKILKLNSSTNYENWIEIINSNLFNQILINKKISKIQQISNCKLIYNPLKSITKEELLLTQPLITINDINLAKEHITYFQ